ncbi:N-acetylmannosamine-6-phosphate 2-epimerase [Clostridium sp. LY3-2]|uniref:N-acetylmannosamine-6-phosphate 2-epimerase n=1 Tax=Clostridium sp. LY3-2 TaxID=2942482 RepID=UPI0021531A2B|nr:N-acetylmannosamine-6-phosphate 2-epimerase [Clostridium sp. LY3-2]MCR6514043.1 N-acetylmannosamine-6-phosphate 2-epimerase [Clostridium sp. LY3-2]
MLDKIKGGLIVSCQALKEEPLHSPMIMGRMAIAAEMGGAVCIRAQGVEDILEIKKNVNLPVIGIIKRAYDDSDIYITPTKKEVMELLSTGCEMIALDCTNRKRPNGEKLKDLIDLIHSKGVLVMADIANFEEGILAEKLGANCVSTTLSGYTDYSNKNKGVDLELISKLNKNLKIPVIAEGRIHSPKDLEDAYKSGAFSAVVGGAITRPQEITKRFVDALN